MKYRRNDYKPMKFKDQYLSRAYLRGSKMLERLGLKFPFELKGLFCTLYCYYIF
jgi:hypothetical protein